MNTYHWHPAIKVNRDGPYAHRYPLHLRQGDLDGACGQHCVLMALTLLGIVTRPQLDNLTQPRSKKLSSFWDKAEPNYFVGTGAEDLKATLHPYAKQVEYKLYRKHCIEHVINSLNGSGIAIVDIESSVLSHWVLAIGIGGLTTKNEIKPRSLLMLDPGYDPIPLTPCNAMLMTRPNVNDQYSFRTAACVQAVSIQQVLTIKRR